MSAWDEIFVNGIYDLPRAGSNPLLVDVGANIGLAGVYWKRRFGTFRYLGFEPDPTAADICRRNLADWDCAATLQECAVGPRDGQVTFERDYADGGHVVTSASPGDAITVPMCRLAPFLAQPVDLLKLDIEGAETDVLRDSAHVLFHVQNIFVEVHCRREIPHDLPVVLTLLHAAGFRTYVHPLLTPRWPFLDLTTTDTGPFDQLVNVYGIRR